MVEKQASERKWLKYHEKLLFSTSSSSWQVAGKEVALL